MSVINTERDLESLLVDIRGEMSQADLEKIAEALPQTALVGALRRKHIEIDMGDRQSDGEIMGLMATLPARLIGPAFINRFNPTLGATEPPWSREEISRPTRLGWYGKFSVLTSIFLAWRKAPALRLGQLITNARRSAPAAFQAGDSWLFFATNALLASQIEAFVQEYTAPKE